MKSEKHALSVVTITYNEEAHIARLIRSVAGLADEVLVVDSYSTDRTVAVAKELGARVIQHPFTDYRSQKEYAIGQATHDRILFLDGDEALSAELQVAVREALQHWPADCYWMNRLSSIGGHWMRHGAWYPDRKMRLFDRRHYRAEGYLIHERLLPAPGARERHLEGDILHYTNADIADRTNTVNRFSSVAAQARIRQGKGSNWFRVLVKPGIRFLSEYLLKGGFRDGFYGYVVARTSAQYVFLREVKTMELRRQGARGSR